MRAFALSSISIAAVIVGCNVSPAFQLTGGTGARGAGAGGAGGSDAGSVDGGTGGAGGLGLGGAFGVGGGTSVGGCSQAAELVYVFDTNDVIHSFDPRSKTFEEIATARCAGNPNSMAIDRSLVAWLNFVGGIYTFDLKTNGPCKLAVDLTRYPGFEQVGMGFATDTVGGTTETLYLDAIGGAGLARVDMTNMTVLRIGTFSNDPHVQGESGELTGTGDARLFGYFTTAPFVRVAQIDRTNAGILSDDVLNGFTPPADWAFSFWGGDFYLYAYPVAQNHTPNSSVIRYSPATGTVDFSYVPDVGFTIIGAGVSTCAPFKPPT